MNMSDFKVIYTIITGVTAGYLTSKILDKATEDVLLEGGMTNAFLMGAGQGAVSVAVGVTVAQIIGKAI